MKTLKIQFILLLSLFAIITIGQEISVIHIEGDAFSSRVVDGKEQYAKLIYGPLNNYEKIVIKKNSKVKLLGQNKTVSVLDREGEYLVGELSFNEVKESSIFDKFCDYFHAFFVHHNSAESKSNYKNNIYAISRGSMAPPSLDFPLEGKVTADIGPLEFKWTHDCDSCEYIFNIYDYTSRELIYTMMTEEKTVEVVNPTKYFKSGVEYYWTVKIVGEDLEYEAIQFLISETGDYAEAIRNIETELSSIDQSITPAAKMVYVMSELGNDYINYAIQYGFELQKQHPEDDQLSNIIERFWYDALLGE